jgi:hypothetical protein
MCPFRAVCMLLQIMPSQRVLKNKTIVKPTFPHTVPQRKYISGWQHTKHLVQDVGQPSIRKHANKFYEIVPINRVALQDHYPASLFYICIEYKQEPSTIIQQFHFYISL